MTDSEKDGVFSNQWMADNISIGLCCSSYVIQEMLEAGRALVKENRELRVELAEIEREARIERY